MGFLFCESGARAIFLLCEKRTNQRRFEERGRPEEGQIDPRQFGDQWVRFMKLAKSNHNGYWRSEAVCDCQHCPGEQSGDDDSSGESEGGGGGSGSEGSGSGDDNNNKERRVDSFDLEELAERPWVFDTTSSAAPIVAKKIEEYIRAVIMEEDKKRLDAAREKFNKELNGYVGKGPQTPPPPTSPPAQAVGGTCAAAAAAAAANTATAAATAAANDDASATGLPMEEEGPPQPPREEAGARGGDEKMANGDKDDAEEAKE